MGFVIGMDEAGYGPNLGPLVLTAIVWEVPGPPHETDFWKTFAGITRNEAAQEDGGPQQAAAATTARPRNKNAGNKAEPAANQPAKSRRRKSNGVSAPQARENDWEGLHIADSKEVYSPAGGLGTLERGALAALGVASRMPSALDELLRELSGETLDESNPWAASICGRDLWFSDEFDLPLPVSEDGRTAASAAEKWRNVCDTTGVHLRAI